MGMIDPNLVGPGGSADQGGVDTSVDSANIAEWQALLGNTTAAAIASFAGQSASGAGAAGASDANGAATIAGGSLPAAAAGDAPTDNSKAAGVVPPPLSTDGNLAFPAMPANAPSPIDAVSTQTVTFAGSGLVFNNTFGGGATATFKNEVVAAETYLESQFKSNLTVSASFDLQALNPAFSGENSFGTTTVTYAQYVNALKNEATTAVGARAVAALTGLSDPSRGAGFYLPNAYARMLGLGNAGGTDDSVILNTVYWTASALQNDPTDAEAVLEHELSEGSMGRIGSLGKTGTTLWAPMDLFRFTATGARDFTGGQDGKLTYFSPDGSGVNTGLQFHNSINGGGTFDGFDLADWDQVGADINATDPFGPGGPGAGDPGTLSATDIAILQALGWNSTPTVTPAFASPQFVLPNFGASPQAGGWGNQSTYPVAVGDVSGDGKADIVGFGAAGVYVSLATGGGNFASPVLGLAAFGADSGWGTQNTYPLELGDVNGDGKADVVGFGAAGVYVALSNGNGTFASPILGVNAFGAAAGWGNQSQYPTELADVTGNGRADIVGLGAAGVYVSLSKGDGTFAQPILALNAFGADAGWGNQTQYPIELADVTGNGRADIVGFGAAGVYVSLANGDGTFAQPILALNALGADAGWGNQQLYPMELADVLGNGRDDIVAFGAAGVYVALANGDGTFAQPVLATDNFGAIGGWNNQNQYPRLMGDVSGDKKADIVAFGSAGVYVALSQPTGGAPFALNQS